MTNSFYLNFPDPMKWAIGLWLFAFGACAGSFMNVVIWRLPLRRSVVYPGSRCPNCGHAVRSYDNIPIFNWFILRGRCRDCGIGISWRYPAVETLVASLFVLVAILEPLRQGANLPHFPEASQYNWPGLISLWVLYAIQMLLLCTLVCSSLMWFDGNWPLEKVFAPVAIASLFAPLLWTELRPEQWIDTFTSLDPRVAVASESVAAILFAAVTAAIVAPTLYPRCEKTPFTVAMWELAVSSLVFGISAAARIVTVASFLVLLAMLLSRLKKDASRIVPFGAYLMIAAVLHIALWKQSANWMNSATGGHSWLVVPVALVLTTAFSLLAKVLGGQRLSYIPAWNRDWPISRKAIPMSTKDRPANVEAICTSPSYKLADSDTAFLQRPELRPVRLQLELLKPEMTLVEQGVQSTVVVFGGTQIIEKAAAEKRLADARAAAQAAPSDPLLARAVSRCERLLAKAHFYDAAREFAQIASTHQKDGHCDFVVVTGGGPGIMEAANRGAHDVAAKSVGLNITLPEEQLPNPYITPELCFQFRYFALRKMHFVIRAKALVVFPGGFGTMDELFEVLTLRQTKRMQAIPVILYSREYWNRVLNLQFLADEGVIADEHLSLIEYAESPQETWELICRFHKITF